MNINIAEVQITGVGPYSQNKYFNIEKAKSEDWDTFENRVWKNRLHVNKETGKIFIPPISWKKSLMEAAKRLAVKLPSNNPSGKSTFGKIFGSGIMVSDQMELIHRDDCPSEVYLVEQGGRGSRVPKRFPMIYSWKGKLNFYVLDEMIGRDIFEEHIKYCGMFIGIGRFRVGNGGENGRFAAKLLSWNSVFAKEIM